MVKLLCIAVMLANLSIMGNFWFGLDSVPDWAMADFNTTATRI